MRDRNPGGTTNAPRRHLVVLQREIGRAPYLPLLADLRAACSFFRETDWTGLARWFRVGRDLPAGDCIIAYLLMQLRVTADPHVSTTLLYLFHPLLARMYRRRKAWLADPDELWSIVCVSFLTALARLLRAERQELLARKLLNDTGRRLFDECKRYWRQDEPLLSFEDLDPDDHSFAVLDPAIEVADARVECERLVSRVERASAGRLISLADADLLLGTRIYGETLHEAAARVGISYEAAKKRRRRAEQRTVRRPDGAVR